MGIPIKFDPKVCETIGYYLYTLRDPRDRSIFYVGKGVGTRCFNHIADAKDNVKDTEKLKTIREILDARLNVDIDIVRHGLDEKTAFKVEAALIDVLGVKHGLKSKVDQISGHDVEHGLKSAEEIQILYGAEPLIPKESLLLIKINKQWKSDMTIDQVYKAVRWYWRMDIKRAKKTRYVLAVAHGIVRGVFEDMDFRQITDSEAAELGEPKAKGRVYFSGVAVADSDYLHTSTKEFGRPGEQTPFRYVGSAA